MPLMSLAIGAAFGIFMAWSGAVVLGWLRWFEVPTRLDIFLFFLLRALAEVMGFWRGCLLGCGSNLFRKP